MSWKSMLMATAVASVDADDPTETSEVIEVTEADARNIRGMIREQLAAFRAGDANRAWRFASEGIRQTFGQPDRLLALIQQKYRALIDLKQLSFGDWQLTPDGLGIELDVVDTGYRRHRMLYLMVLEADGWKVNGAVPVGTDLGAEAA